MREESSERARSLRRELIATIPRFPNDRVTKQVIESKSLLDLLIIYVGWKLRFVAQRPRRVTGLSALATRDCSATLRSNIEGFVEAVERGDDLNPYLSRSLVSRGYTPVSERDVAAPNIWADKDFVLNIMGLHHFHTGASGGNGSAVERTKKVLFASVNRDEVEILGLLDHTAFRYEDDGNMTPKRKRLWEVFTKRQEAGLMPGQFAFGGFGGHGVALSGQPVAVVRAAQEHVAIMGRIDPKLDGPVYLHSIYGAGKVPAKPRLKWHYRHLDFGLLDQQAEFFGVYSYGPN